MKELTEDKLLSILDWIEKTIIETRDFVTEQTPLVVEELLSWHFTLSLLHFGVTCLFLISFLFFLTNTLRIGFKNNFGEDSFIKVMINLSFAIILFLITLFNISSPNFLTWLKIKMAPRVWLLEHLNAEFLK